MSEIVINLKSSILSGPTDITVLLPEPQPGVKPAQFYTSGEEYPVLWLLHGGNSDRNEWLRCTNIARHALERKFMVVIPNALNSDFANHPEFADGYNFSDFFFEELMPFIYNWLPASRKPEDNFVAGSSMGGAAVWMYGLMHPELFAAMAPLSSPPKDYIWLESYRELTGGEFRAKAEREPRAFPAGFGDPAEGIHQKEINMIAKYPTVGEFLDSWECTWSRFGEAAGAGTLPQIYITCGTEDRNYAKLLEFQFYAQSLGMTDIVYEFVPGFGHGYPFWDYALPRVLDFFNL